MLTSAGAIASVDSTPLFGQPYAGGTLRVQPNEPTAVGNQELFRPHAASVNVSAMQDAGLSAGIAVDRPGRGSNGCTPYARIQCTGANELSMIKSPETLMGALVWTRSMPRARSSSLVRVGGEQTMQLMDTGAVNDEMSKLQFHMDISRTELLYGALTRSVTNTFSLSKFVPDGICKSVMGDKTTDDHSAAMLGGSLLNVVVQGVVTTHEWSSLASARLVYPRDGLFMLLVGCVDDAQISATNLKWVPASSQVLCSRKRLTVLLQDSMPAECEGERRVFGGWRIAGAMDVRAAPHVPAGVPSTKRPRRQSAAEVNVQPLWRTADDLMAWLPLAPTDLLTERCDGTDGCPANVLPSAIACGVSTPTAAASVRPLPTIPPAAPDAAGATPVPAAPPTRVRPARTVRSVPAAAATPLNKLLDDVGSSADAYMK